MRLHRLTFMGLRNTVMHYYLETEASVIFAAGADMIYQYNCIRSNQEKLAKAMKESGSYESEEVNDRELAAMVDDWWSTGDRWRADALKAGMEERIMNLCKDSDKRAEERAEEERKRIEAKKTHYQFGEQVDFTSKEKSYDICPHPGCGKRANSR